MRMNFRRRLLLSHILPVVLLVPIIGLALIYIIENQLILPTLANEMINQGMLVARLVKDNNQVWKNPTEAQALLDSLNVPRPTRIGLLTNDHILLATSRPDDQSLVGKVFTEIPSQGNLAEPWWAVTPGALPNEQVLDAVVPVRNNEGTSIGLVRIYRKITDIDQSLSNIRLLILGVLLIGLLISGTLAVLLSESVSQPLKRITQAIASTPLEGETRRLPEKGSDEVSALAKAYNRLQENRENLEKNRLQMVANVVHEIGRPLGSMRTAVDALLSGALEDPSLRVDLVQGISERVDRIGRLLEDLALTYRLLTPHEIHLRQVVIEDWIKSLTPLWAETARQKGIDWDFSLTAELSQITTDPDRLAQALSNLVNNAIKFTPVGGKVRLSIYQAHSLIKFEVYDTGPGIALEEQPHLFTPFHRSVQPSWKAPGLGLGLSIAHSIINSLGGKITFVSNPGQGSTFTIEHPVS
jgi:two-component system, OmpR family, sensor histidine kinase BaeS